LKVAVNLKNLIDVKYKVQYGFALFKKEYKMQKSHAEQLNSARFFNFLNDQKIVDAIFVMKLNAPECAILPHSLKIHSKSIRVGPGRDIK
jgi:hypothetical protein